ncbi:MAG: PAS domain-containing protein [Betaproteobacteria bacterium]|nr:PAS domain-containing protein [Betaproteobacteria bacterium]
MSIGQIREVVYSLQTHEIELKIQNEALRAAEIQLVESRDRLSDLYDFVPVGYLTLDRDSTILAANLATATMLGSERERVITQKLARFLAPRKPGHPLPAATHG